ncbi:hypothetical protein [Streptomyces sp. NBC_00019]|uniref:hypothetical protein n=1 Tax=Streptomyces sp. NBC_00019 TaxID=2975623 RepID=UPI0032545039
MDGSALDPLCAAWEDCHGRLGWMRVVHHRPGASLVFRAGGLQDRFPRYASTEDAWQGVPADRAGAHPARVMYGGSRRRPALKSRSRRGRRPVISDGMAEVLRSLSLGEVGGPIPS